MSAVSRLDRYQASKGEEVAATLVAEAAEAAGLTDVTVHRFPADGTVRWWSFASPVAWTPITARLEVRTGYRDSVLVDHALEPCSIATYSAATPPGGVAVPLVRAGPPGYGPLRAGALAVVDRTEFLRPGFLDDLAAAGSLGFVTDAASVGMGSAAEYAGRIELDPDTSLVGFSVTSQRLTQLAASADAGGVAQIAVEIDRSASMAAVTGVLEGLSDDAREVWLTAHLCHPRPGANDNASGVGGLLGVAAAHSTSRRADRSWATRRTLRFVWAPEFAGTAAVLHGRMAHGGDRAVPVAGINLDMVGDNQALCGGPFLVERPPAGRPTLIAPVTEYLVREVFAATARQAGTWRAVPFAGSSDHAVLADAKLDCATVSLRHEPDRFNHSAGDTLDKVSEVEMQRSAATGAALAQIMADDGALSSGALATVVREWCKLEETEAHSIARRYASVHGGVWSNRFLRRARQDAAAVLALVDPKIPLTRDPDDDRDTGRPCLSGQWDGPLNLRALIADLPPATRRSVEAIIRRHRSNYAVFQNLAMLATGSLDREALVAEASFALRHPVEPAVGEPLVEALLESGWVTEVPPGDPT